MSIIINFLLNDIIFLPTLFRTFHSRSSSSSNCSSILVFCFGLFNNWLDSISMSRDDSFLRRRNIFLYFIFIDSLRFPCRFSNLAISERYWSFTWAIGDYTTCRRYISYMRVIILRMIRIGIINILGFLTIFKWNIRTLFCYLNRFYLRRRNINIIYLVCNILINFLFFFYDAFFNWLFFLWRFINVFCIGNFLINS